MRNLDSVGARTVRLASATACAVMLVAIAACGGSDATGPGTTHPSLDAATIGTSANKLQAVTSQPVLAAMLAQGSAIGLPSFARGVVRLPGLVPRLASGSLPGASRLAPSARLAGSPLASRVSPRLTPSVPHATLGDPTALIPDTLLGKTLVPDATGAFAVDPTLTGAPSNGVRFIVRTPGTTQDIGYADLTESVSGAASTLTLDIKTPAGAVVMHNVEAMAISGSSETDALSGYATNGTDRMDYVVNIVTTPTRTTSTTTIGAPSANVAVADTAVLDGMTAADVHVSRITVGSTVIRITAPAVVDAQNGGYVESDTSKVTVNGAPFATIAISASGTPSITAPDGSALSSSDMSALTSVVDILISAGTLILAPVVVVLWLLIATSAY